VTILDNDVLQPVVGGRRLEADAPASRETWVPAAARRSGTRAHAHARRTLQGDGGRKALARIGDSSPDVIHALTHAADGSPHPAVRAAARVARRTLER
jgi:hypothetical protein